MCKNCEIIKNNTTNILPKNNVEYYVIKKGSKVYGMPTEMESLSIDPFDGSLPDEHYATKKLNKTVTFHKNWLSEKIKIKEKSYTIFYHKYFRNLITETSNVLELNTFQN